METYGRQNRHVHEMATSEKRENAPEICRHRENIIIMLVKISPIL